MASKYYKVFFDSDDVRVSGVASRPVVVERTEHGDVRGLAVDVVRVGVNVWVEAPGRWVGMPESVAAAYLRELGVEADSSHAHGFETRKREDLYGAAQEAVGEMAEPEGRVVVVTIEGTTSEGEVELMGLGVKRHFGERATVLDPVVVEVRKQGNRTHRVIELRVVLSDLERRPDKDLIELAVDKCEELYGAKEKIHKGKMAVSGSVRGSRKD